MENGSEWKEVGVFKVVSTLSCYFLKGKMCRIKIFMLQWKKPMLTMQDLEEISHMVSLFCVLFVSLLMKHRVISCARNKMPYWVTVGLIQAANSVFRNLSPTKNEYLGE